MREIRPASSGRTWFVCRRPPFLFVDFLVRMWLRFAWPHLNLPEAVFRKRLAAPRWVLILIFAIAMSFRVFVTDLGGGLSHSFRPARAGLSVVDPGGISHQCLIF